MNRTAMVGIFALLLVGIVAIAGNASANRFGFMQGNISPQGTEAAAQTAIENNDFTAWKAAIESTLSQENFDRLVTMHKQTSDRQAKEQAVRDAINSGDYNAYVAAINALNNLVSASAPLNESDFTKLVAEHQARLNGNSTNMGRQGIPHMGRGFGLGRI
jgi:hypothetical protein